MEKKTWIFPLAGNGTRVKSIGKHKNFIKIYNRLSIEWFFLSIRKNINKKDSFIFIIQKKHNIEFNFQKKIVSVLKDNKLKNNYKFIITEELPQGPADSVRQSLEVINNDNTVVIINADQYLDFEFPNMKKADVGVPIYINFNSSSSFAKIENNKILKIVEKKLISNYATAGVYIFKNGITLKKMIQNLFNNKPNFKNEYFIGPGINYLIKNKKTVLPSKVFIKYDLGSIEGINMFEKFLMNIVNEL